MKKVCVVASNDIVTDKSFTIAKSGLTGFALSGRQPHDVNNFGKVLVQFKGREHGYWCHPDSLTFPEGSVVLDYVSKPPPPEFRKVLPAIEQAPKYNFGRNLQILRDSRNLSQAELGNLMRRYGVRLAQSTVCYRENSAYCPSGKFVNAVAGALKVPAFILFLPLDNNKVFSDARKYIGSMSSSLEE